MAKKGLRKKKRSSQSKEETSKMSNICDTSTSQGEISQETHQLGSVLRRIVDQIDDAERSNADTLHEMQERLSSLSEKTTVAKEQDTEVDKEDLEKIENKIAGLSNRIEVISQGRSINADDLEDRIEALADQLSDDEDEGGTDTVDNNSSSQEEIETVSHSIDDADITFAVTDDMNDDSGVVSSNDTVTLPTDISPGSINIPEVENAVTHEAKKSTADHKIRASTVEITGPIAPQRLASLAEHFSPAMHVPSEDQDENISESSYKPVEQNSVEGQAKSGLEDRFAVIATRLEEALAHREQDRQERVDITNKFDDLAAKFESWLNSKHSERSVAGIEKKIDALSEHVRQAENYASRIDKLEQHVLKLIDLVENNKQVPVSEENFAKAFEKIATQILEEKSGKIADVVVSKMEIAGAHVGDAQQLKDLERSISALNSERRIAEVNQSRDFARLSDSLGLVSDRLEEIEEKLSSQNYASHNHGQDFEPTLNKDINNQDDHDDGDDRDDLGSTLVIGKEIDLSLGDDEETEKDDDSFHTVLELSVNEALDTEGQEENNFQSVTEPPSLDSFKSEQVPDIPEPPARAEHQEVRREPPSLEFSVEKSLADEKRSADAIDDEFVEAARRAAEEAYEKKELETYSLATENKAEHVIDSFIERKEQFVEKSKELRKRIFGFRVPNSSSVFFLLAAGLVVICFGILFKELFYAANSLAPNKIAAEAFQERITGGKNAALSERVVDNSGVAQNVERIVPQLHAQDRGRTFSRGYQSNGKKITGQAGDRVVGEGSHKSRPVNKVRGISRGQEFSPHKLNVAAVNNGASATENKQRESAELERMLHSNTDPAKRDYQIDMRPALARQHGYLQIGENVRREEKTQYISKSEFDKNSPEGGLVLPPEKIGSLSLRTAAASGNYKAQFAVAMRFIAGIRIKQNYPAALRWLRRSASQSFAPAQFQLAMLYEKGHGAEPDIGKAKTWYMRAARRGNMKAMHRLAVLFTNSADGGADFGEALQWYRRAASYGYPDSLMQLGSFYKKGLGVKADKIEAYKWFSLAHSRGDVNAEKELNALKFKMSEDDIFHAEAALAQWSQRAPNRASNLTEKEVAAFTGRIMPPFADALIYEAQLLLNKLGYDVGPADGQVGPKTRDAVRAFQMKNGLEATGQITPRVLSHLSRQAG